MDINQNRRSFLKTVALAVGALAVTPVLKLQEAFGELVKLDLPIVKALGYVHNAKDAKDRKDKKANCGNCSFYQGAAKSKAATCQLITGGGEVAAEGWCRSWAAKPKKKA
jgi:hypothetical protein